MPDQPQQATPEVVEQARREVNQLVAELEQLAQRDLPPAEFHLQALRRAHAALSADATALWMRTPQGQLQVACENNLKAVGFEQHPEWQGPHGELVGQAAATGETFAAMPGAAPVVGAGAAARNPTASLVMLSPIMAEQRCVGVVEVFLDPARRGSAQGGYLRFLHKVAEEIGKFHRNRRFRQFVGQEKVWNELDAFIRSAHAAKNPEHAAHLIANDGRRLVQCERLSVALRRGEQVRIAAISGQDLVERKSNLVRRMAELVRTVLRHGEPLTYCGVADEGWPRDVARALSRYLEESNSRLVLVQPLRRDHGDAAQAGPPEAALVVEMVEDEAVPEDLAGKVEIVARHGSQALHNALDVSHIFLLPLWRTLGKGAKLFTGTRRATTLTCLAALAAAVAALVVVPWPLRLEGKGELLPVVRRVVHAPDSGLVASLKVVHGAKVGRDAELLTLVSPQLQRDQADFEGKQRAAATRRDLAQKELTDRQLSPSDRDRVRRELSEAELQVVTYGNQLKLVRDQLRRLSPRAPIAGEILDWQPEQKLAHRTVQQGDELLTVADTAGEWHVEVQLPERIVAHLARARAAAGGRPLPVELKFAAAPERTFRGRLVEISTQASPVEDQNTVLGIVKLDEPAPADLRKAGAEVRVKVDCGLAASGYVLFREAIDFVREYVFF